MHFWLLKSKANDQMLMEKIQCQSQIHTKKHFLHEIEVENLATLLCLFLLILVFALLLAEVHYLHSQGNLMFSALHLLENCVLYCYLLDCV